MNVLRLALALVLVGAAVAKLADRRDGRTVLVSLGELTLAGLLVPAATARAAAIATGVFLLAASVVVARKDEPCGCFGEAVAMSRRAALVRNAVLVAVAVAVALTAPPAMSAGVAIAAGVSLVLAGQVWAWWQLLQQNGRLLARVEALEHPLPTTPPPGTPAPNFVLPDGDGRPTTLGDLLSPDGLVLVFTDPGCGTCADIPERLARIDGGAAVAIITRGEAGAFAPTLLQAEHEVARLYGAGRMPSALRIAPDGRVASPLVHGPDAIEQLIRPAVLEVIR